MLGVVQLQLQHLVYYHSPARLHHVLACSQITVFPRESKTLTSKQENWFLSKPEILMWKHCCRFFLDTKAVSEKHKPSPGQSWMYKMRFLFCKYHQLDSEPILPPFCLSDSLPTLKHTDREVRLQKKHGGTYLSTFADFSEVFNKC